MKTYFKITITVLCICSFLNKLQAQNQKALDKIESAKIALITERLDLTPQQAQKFWPIYNEYSEERRVLRRQYRDFRKDLENENLSEEESKLLLEKRQKFKSRQLKLEEKYTAQLSTVITNKQLLQLRSAEEDFRAMLLKKLEQRSNARGKKD